MEQLKKIQLNPDLSDRKKLEQSLGLANFKDNVAPKMHAIRLANDKTEHQQVIEKRLIG
jgi:hypothetical protein